MCLINIVQRHTTYWALLNPSLWVTVLRRFSSSSHGLQIATEIYWWWTDIADMFFVKVKQKWGNSKTTITYMYEIIQKFVVNTEIHLPKRHLSVYHSPKNYKPYIFIYALLRKKNSFLDREPWKIWGQQCWDHNMQPI